MDTDWDLMKWREVHKKISKLDGEYRTFLVKDYEEWDLLRIELKS